MPLTVCWACGHLGVLNRERGDKLSEGVGGGRAGVCAFVCVCCVCMYRRRPCS